MITIPSQYVFRLLVRLVRGAWSERWGEGVDVVVVMVMEEEVKNKDYLQFDNYL